VPTPDLVSYLNRIAATYGLGPEEFLDLFAQQGHACDVCRKPLTLFAEDLAEAPVVDHDHDTGKVRGLLCRGCNTAVGFIEKDQDRTRNALAYLMRHVPQGFGKHDRSRKNKTLRAVRKLGELAALDTGPPED
jgi:hypothetical protein